MGLHGSYISESNHASALVHLNDGKKKGNNFCEHHILLISDLLMRQKILLHKTSTLLWQDWRRMRTVRSTLQQLQSTPKTQDLLHAAQELNIASYESFREARELIGNFRVDSAHAVDPESPQDT